MSTENPGGGAGAASVEALTERTGREAAIFMGFAVKELRMVDAKYSQQKRRALKMFIFPDGKWHLLAGLEEGH